MKESSSCGDLRGCNTSLRNRHPMSRKESGAHDGYQHALTGQLDLFAHSRTTILPNDLLDSVLERDNHRVDQLLDRELRPARSESRTASRTLSSHEGCNLLQTPAAQIRHLDP